MDDGSRDGYDNDCDSDKDRDNDNDDNVDDNNDNDNSDDDDNFIRKRLNIPFVFYKTNQFRKYVCTQVC